MAHASQYRRSKQWGSMHGELLEGFPGGTVRILTVAVVVLLFTVPAVVAGADLNAAVTSVEVSPTSPVPGEPVTITTTVENLPSSDDPLEITDVALRGAGSGIDEYSRVESVGTIAPGSTIQVPLTRTFESSGTKNLRVHVYGQNVNTSESVSLRYPVTVDVKERHPQVDVQTNDSVAGIESSGTVVVANGLDTDISNIEVTVEGQGVEVLESRTVLASLPSGEDAKTTFTYLPESPGTHELEVTVEYAIHGDTVREMTRTKSIQVAERNDRLLLDASPDATGGRPAVALDVINRGNTPAEDVLVTASAPNATFERQSVSEIPAGTSERVRLNATLEGHRANATIRVDYETGTTERSLTTSTVVRSDPGTIELTGLDVTEEGDRIQISGSASNLGSTEVDSVVVRALPTDGVTPTFPNKEYFVGTVPASDFVSFEVYVSTSGEVSTVPLEAAYTVDGERVRKRFEVDVSSTVATPRPGASGEAGQLESAVPILIGGIVTLAVGAIIVIGWRNKS